MVNTQRHSSLTSNQSERQRESPVKSFLVFVCRLTEIVRNRMLNTCGENTIGFGGSCISDSDTANLWRLYLEVYTVYYTDMIIRKDETLK